MGFIGERAVCPRVRYCPHSFTTSTLRTSWRTYILECIFLHTLTTLPSTELPHWKRLIVKSTTVQIISRHETWKIEYRNRGDTTDKITGQTTTVQNKRDPGRIQTVLKPLLIRNLPVIWLMPVPFGIHRLNPILRNLMFHRTHASEFV